MSSTKLTRVIAVCRSDHHGFSKPECSSITLLTGLGVEGDAHLGRTVKHRSRVKADPTQPNQRQVHLIHAELLDALVSQGFSVAPGVMGENITTRGLDLLGLPRGSKLHIGSTAIIEITGLRNPCKQLDEYQDGLMQAVLERSASGELIRKAGVMGIVTSGGDVVAGDEIRVVLPAQPHQALERV